MLAATLKDAHLFAPVTTTTFLLDMLAEAAKARLCLQAAFQLQKCGENAVGRDAARYSNHWVRTKSGHIRIPTSLGA
jgi:hypothetical protein